MFASTVLGYIVWSTEDCWENNEGLRQYAVRGCYPENEEHAAQDHLSRLWSLEHSIEGQKIEKIDQSGRHYRVHGSDGDEKYTFDIGVTFTEQMPTVSVELPKEAKLAQTIEKED